MAEWEAYPFWYLAGRELIEMLHKVKNYLKDYRTINKESKYGQALAKSKYIKFTTELRSLFELINPLINKKNEESEKKIKAIELPKKVDDEKEWIETYHKIISAMLNLRITDIGRKKDEEGVDEELYYG